MQFASAMMLALTVAVLACAVYPSNADVVKVLTGKPAPAATAAGPYRVMSIWEAEFRQAELKAATLQWDICGLSGGSVSGYGYATKDAPGLPTIMSPDARALGCIVYTNDAKKATVTTLENVASGRYAFDFKGKPISPHVRGAEGGWANVAPQAVTMSNATNTQAIWVIIPVTGVTGTYLIQNMATNRYMFDTGNNKMVKDLTKRGAEGGWLGAPAAVTTDANYYNLAYWKFQAVAGMDGVFLISNAVTNRYLFNSNLPADKWPVSANLVTADANYYNNAYWRIAGLKL